MATPSTVARGAEKSKRQLYWEWLRDHPSSSSREVGEAFGIDQTQTATIMTKFLAKGIVTRTKHGGVYCYTTVGDEYPVMSLEERVSFMLEARAANRLKAKAKRKYTKRAAPARAAVEKTLEERKRELIAPTVSQGFVDSTQAFINSLTVHQAKAVYEELKKIFGG